MQNLSNIIAALGTLLIVVAVAGLAGGWWACLVLGVFLLASAYALHLQAAPPVELAEVTPLHRERVAA
jgi:hypothetical protein